MNYAHIHLILNHLPVITIPFATVFLIFSIYKKNNQVKMFSLLVLAIACLSSVPVYYTGEPAEHAIEDIPSVTESVIHPHEEMAEKSLILSLVTMAAAIAAIALTKNEKRNRQLTYLTVGLALFTSMALGYTASLGGQIRHTETRESKN